MVDTNKSIEDVEKEIGHKLTDEQKKVAEGLVQLMNALWNNIPGGDYERLIRKWQNFF